MAAIYLDHASTTLVLPEVVVAMRPFWDDAFGNPASAHGFGRRARQGLEAAREQVAELLGALPTEVIFTSGATEANNLALHGLAATRSGQALVAPIEHPSVIEPVRQLQKRGWQVQMIPVRPNGVADLDRLELAEAPQLAALMLVNNETGSVQPVAELARRIPCPVHCDAVQAVGKQQVHFHDLGVATLSLSAHKLHGPRGVGALLVRHGTRLTPLCQGGHQQQALRPGTEPVLLAVGLAKALELAVAEMPARQRRVRELRDRLLNQLRQAAAPVILNGDPDGSPYILNLSFPGCAADALLMKLDLAGIACSTGSACSSGSLLPSPVLRAMGCPPEVLHSSLRFSFSHLLDEAAITSAVSLISDAVNTLRRQPDEPA